MTFTPDPKQPDLSRLKTTLITSGLQQKDNPTFQVIDGLIKSVESFQSIINTNISSINNIINNIGINKTIINNPFVSLINDYDEFIPSLDIPGPIGLKGLDGINGKPGIDGIDSEENSYQITPFSKRNIEFVTDYLISNTSLTITPLAGQNLNITLSTTGDFAVNTNQLYVDTSTARVGINTSVPGFSLECVGVGVVGSFYMQDAGTYTIVGRNTAGAHFRLDASNNVYIFNGATQNFLLSSNGSLLTPQFSASVTTGRTGINTVGPSVAFEAVGESVVGTFYMVDGGTYTITGRNTQGFHARWDTSDNLALFLGATQLFKFTSASSIGKLAIGNLTPTARLHLETGTATANTAPLKFNSGTVLTTAEAGAVEFNTDDFFATITTGAARKGIILDNGSRLTSGKIPVATTNGRLIDATAALLITGTIPTIVGTTFEKAETGTDSNVLTYTPGGTDEYLLVMVSTDVSALTGTSLAITTTWKDSNNNTQTSTVTLTGVADGTINIPINAKASQNVVVSTVFVGVSTTYNISAIILRLK